MPAQRFIRPLQRLGVTYLVVLLFLAIFQRHLLFQPWPGPSEPDRAGLVDFSRRHIAGRDAAIYYWWHAGKPRMPVLFYFHGNAGGLHMFTPMLQWFAAHGFAIAAMEYRGYPGSEGQPSQHALVADARRLIAAVTAQTPKRKHMVWGYSLGTGVAVGALARSKQRPDALVLEAPFTSVRNRAQELFPIFPAGRLMRDPFDSYAAIDNIHAPLCMLHGENDNIIPIAHGKALFARANNPKQFIAVPEGTHLNLMMLGGYDKVLGCLKAMKVL